MRLRIAIGGYIIFLLLFMIQGTFGSQVWTNGYMMWDKLFGAGLVPWYVVYKTTKEPRLVAPIVVFSLIRFVWEPISQTVGIAVDNQWYVGVLFLILTLITGYLCFRPNSTVVIFIDKHIP